MHTFKITVENLSTGQVESTWTSTTPDDFRQAALHAAETPMELWITEAPKHGVAEGWTCRCGASLLAGTTIEDHADFCTLSR